VFSDDSNKPIGSDEDPSVSDENRQEATPGQQAQHRLLRQLDRVSVPPIRYD